MKIGVFGGTFNPVHLGHQVMVDAFQQAVAPDKLLVIPNRVPPHKEAPDLASEVDRLALLGMAFAGKPTVEIDQREWKRPGKSYTLDTVSEILAENPGAEIFLLIGGDSLRDFETWHCFRELFSLVTVVAVTRKGVSEEAETSRLAQQYREKYGAKILLLQSDIPDVSSTQIRAAVASGNDLSGLVDENVANYLHRHDLYLNREKEAIEQKTYGISFAKSGVLIQTHLTGHRRFHSFMVAKTAMALAERYHADPVAAGIAGRLHDLYRQTERESLLRQVKSCGKMIDDLSQLPDPLLHGRAGGLLLAEQFGVCKEICRAVTYHTEGRADMDLLTEILFVADAISEDRHYSDVDEVRALAQKDLHQATAYIYQYMEQELGDHMTKDSMEGAAYYQALIGKGKTMESAGFGKRSKEQ